MTISIPDLLARRDAIAAAAEGLPDHVYDKVMAGVWTIERAILAAPAAGYEDIETKLSVWDEFIDDPMLNLENREALWWQLRADIRRVIV